MAAEIVFAFFLPLMAQDPSSVSKSHLVWTDVQIEYASFDEIKPTLVNKETYSIFLSRVWPFGSAQLVRYNEATASWEPGHFPSGCGTVVNAKIPIELKPGERKPIHVFWQSSTDDWDHPQFFQLQEYRERRPIKGKYRFILRYSLTPWTVFQFPKQVLVAESEEFQVR